MIRIESVQIEPDCWQPIPGLSGERKLKPDAYVVWSDREFEHHAFLEIDRGTEDLGRIVRKAERDYGAHWRSGMLQAEVGLYPQVIWVAHTPRRARALREALAEVTDGGAELHVICTEGQFQQFVGDDAGKPS